MKRIVLLALDTSTEFCSVALLVVDQTTDPAVDSTVEPGVDSVVDPAVDFAVDPIVDSALGPTLYQAVESTVARAVDPTVNPAAGPTVDATVDPTVDPTTDPTVDPTVYPAADSAAGLAHRSARQAAAHYASGQIQVWFTHESTGPVSSTRLLPAIRELFDLAGLKLADCSAVAFGSGPGSFTGLRTATGVAQGLAFGLSVPVVPISTLLACAEFARTRDPSATRVLAALDARMSEAYWADYRWDSAADDWVALQPASLDVPEAIPMPNEPFTLAGNAAAVFGERMATGETDGLRGSEQSEQSEQSTATPSTQPVRMAQTGDPSKPRALCRIDLGALPHALPVALAGLRALRAGRTVAPDQAAPEYVRNKVAQTTAERMQARAEKDAAAKLDRQAEPAGPAPEPIR
jgi:tRNA threonylcarbamoyladenosine biosynthesis protein TsaB